MGVIVRDDAGKSVVSDLADDMNSADHSSDIGTSLTSFEDILKPDKETDWIASGSSHSKNDSTTAEMPYAAPVCFMELSDTACSNGHQRAQDAQLEASQCAEGARDRVHECIREFFSPEQEKARTLMVKRAVTKIRQSLHACHDTVDLMLVRVFEQPVQEVEVRTTFDQSYSMSFNEDITIDSELKRPETDDAALRTIRISDGGKKEKPMRRARLASKKEKVKKIKRSKKQTPTKEPNQDESLAAKSILALLEDAPATESDVESLARFKESLCDHGTIIEETKSGDVLTDLLRDKESRTELETPSSTSMDELDRILRTDIEKLDRITGTSRLVDTIEMSHSDPWKITASSSTPLRGNRRLDSDSEYLDLSQIRFHSKMKPILLTEPLPIENSTALLSLQVHRAGAAPVDEEIIDLTMYDESFDKPISDAEFLHSRAEWQWT